jgi:DNA mismatch repair protein MutL
MKDASEQAARVHNLPEELIRKMAAGEVVERPASVIKELVENSVDAGARRIEVGIENAGLGSISVADDGCGMDPGDMRASLGRHATSKISCEEDLWRVATLGFRGEALASIASVSRLEMTSRLESARSGHRLVSEGGRISEEGEAGAPVGTRIVIRDLFFNTPVRKKFLRSPPTETSKALEAVARIALGFPAAGFSFSSGGRELLSCPPSPGLADRASQVLGGQASSRMFSMSGESGGMSLEAACSSPSYTRGDMSSIYTLVNGRHVLDKGLRRVIADAFSNVVPPGRFPAAVLSLRMPPGEVDVNVHPQKSEVRFRSVQEVYGFVSRAMASSIASAPWLPGRTYELRGPGAAGGAGPHFHRRDRIEPGWAAGGGLAGEIRDPGPGDSPPRQMEIVRGADGYFSRLRFVGQAWGMYPVFEDGDELVLVDQHAAHERLAFDAMMKSFESGRRASQMALIPREVEVSPRHAVIISRHLDTLDRMGFSIEQFGKAAFLVRGVPAPLSGADPGVLITDAADEIETLGREISVTAAAAAVASRIACHAAVRGKHALSGQEAEELMRRLDGVDFGTACPHGRPVHFAIPRAEIERRFGRK